MFHRNERPIYFISATNFNLLGIDRWVNRFRYISYIDCFDGRHPNVFVPTRDAARRVRVDRGHQQLPAAAQGRDRPDRAPRRQAGRHLPDVRREDRSAGQRARPRGLVPAGQAAPALRQQDGNRAHRQQGRRVLGAQCAREGRQLRAPDADRGARQARPRSGRPVGLRRLGPHDLLHRRRRRLQQAQGRDRQRPRGQDHEAHQLPRRDARGLRHAVGHAGRAAADRGGRRARSSRRTRAAGAATRCFPVRSPKGCGPRRATWPSASATSCSPKATAATSTSTS